MYLTVPQNMYMSEADEQNTSTAMREMARKMSREEMEVKPRIVFEMEDRLSGEHSTFSVDLKDIWLDLENGEFSASGITSVSFIGTLSHPSCRCS
jgi:hypothetical protein